ncbi:hypothetical protein AMATHDRAFT_54263 [Amanita thiersii Skay4041]|uniref:PB1 domain-containing protein n=1 Tax=Amanita thiersii Skay4041 TaxID=703135 RepID=A0A2A9NUI2_9AGAR|nr:hypothetical protein AMATHDRAFT_54263 [Amanita thiersii Skay4041]
MSLKAELETWAAALKAYDEEDFGTALDLFNRIADSSKILTNMGLIYATLGEHENAIEKFLEATKLDQYLAVAYFQCGVSNFLLTRYDLAFRDFEEALLYLRGNEAINYEQLGLKFKLYSAEVLFNRGLCQIYMGRIQEGMMTLEDARREKSIEDHNVIDEAIRDRGNGYTVFSIPVGVVYRPSEKKLKNAVTKDYMGKAKLVAATDANDIYTEFSGVTRLKQGISPAGVFLDRPDASPVNLTRSATAPAATLPPIRDQDPTPKSAGVLERAKTTINVPMNARERVAGRSGQSPSSTSPVAPFPPSAPAAAPRAPVNPLNPGRGAPVVRLTRSPSLNRAPPAALNVPPIRDTGADFYDDYLDSYSSGVDNTSSAGPPMPQQPPNMYLNNYPPPPSAWPRNNSLNRSGSRSAPATNYSPSTYGGSIRRKGTKRAPPSSRVPSSFEEEEEGYGSGDYEDVMYDLQKIRVKIHYQDEIRGMTFPVDTTFVEFMEKLTSKFGRALTGLGIKFMDEDGGKVSLRDESDYDMAIETAKENAKGKAEGKLEIWCTNV